MEEKLKKAFPDLKINNSSNRNFNDLIKITELCNKINDVLVFIERNENNNDYFEITEITQNSNKINLIFLNKDDIYYYNIENDFDFDISIMSLKRKLMGENECVVCMEICVNKYYICCKCGHQIHDECFNKCIKQICSVCKNQSFLYNE